MASHTISKCNASLTPLAEATELFEQFSRTPAQIEDQDFRDIEADLAAGSSGINRRCALAMLRKTGAELVAMAQRDRESAVLLAVTGECADRAAARLRTVLQLMESARTRAMVALCVRDDMADVAREAKTRFVDYSMMH